MKWRQSEERKSWSRSLSSSSLAPLGKAVRFLKKNKLPRDCLAQGTIKAPGPRATLALCHAEAGLRKTYSYRRRGPLASHLKLGLPAGLGCCSSGPWAASWRGSVPGGGSCSKNPSRCLWGRGSSLLIRGETGAGGDSLMLWAGKQEGEAFRLSQVSSRSQGFTDWHGCVLHRAESPVSETAVGRLSTSQEPGRE